LEASVPTNASMATLLPPLIRVNALIASSPDLTAALLLTSKSRPRGHVRAGLKRGKMDFNPCLGMDKAHEADPHANREWLYHERNFARENAPLEVLIPMMVRAMPAYAGRQS
jgi:hypothetical protein